MGNARGAGVGDHRRTLLVALALQVVEHVDLAEGRGSKLVKFVERVRVLEEDEHRALCVDASLDLCKRLLVGDVLVVAHLVLREAIRKRLQLERVVRATADTLAADGMSIEEGGSFT